MRGDYSSLDFSQFDAVIAYLSPAAMPALWDKARAEMRPGTSLYSVEFAIPGQPPSTTIVPPGRGPHIARDVETWLAGSAVAFVATDVTLFGVARQIAIIIGNRADVFTSTADATQWLCAADVGRDIPFQR